MTPEQIEKLRAQADSYAQQELPFCHPLSMRFAQVRDTEFARLARAAAFEEAAKAIEPKSQRPCMCDRCDCGNQTDAESCAAWDASTWDAMAIRALAAAEKEPRP